MLNAINERQLRKAIRGTATKPLAYCNIAHKIQESGSPFVPSKVSDVIVYGKGKTRTVAIRTRYGKKLSFETLGKIPANENGYSIAGEWIENWLESPTN